MKQLFWLSVLAVIYPYLGYPLVLWVMARSAARPIRREAADQFPSVTLIIPVHNEAARLVRKLENTMRLRYPEGLLHILIVSDGSADRTVEIARQYQEKVTVLELPIRKGKAAALNAGLERAETDIVAFTDASIELHSDALMNLVRPFRDPRIGCVSGEDRIAESGGEAWYGRYELLLRRLESELHSIAGASGSFYAQRRALCQPFVEGMAPDFLSVLRTVEQGFRAVTESAAVGVMSSVKDPRHEFERKVRTVIRGMTTLFAHVGLLNPVRYGLFSFVLWSHKVLRWTVPFGLIGALVAPLALLDSWWYAVIFGVQAAFYAAALFAFVGWGSIQRTAPGKVALYFSSVNAAILSAWYRYGRGIRQEIWTPSAR